VLELLSEQDKLVLETFHHCFKSLLDILLVPKQLCFVNALNFMKFLHDFFVFNYFTSLLVVAATMLADERIIDITTGIDTHL
jgi:hypothetical protein